jgi:serine protease inhibitor
MERSPIGDIAGSSLEGETMPFPLPLSSSPVTRAGLFLLIAQLIGCQDPTSPGSDTTPAITELPRALTASEIEAISSGNAFGFELMREVARAEPGKTVFLSPFSASMALGMTLNGTAGETFDAMRSTLGFDGLEEAEINTAYRDLLDLLSGLDPDVELAVGNAIWHRQELALQSDFRSRVEEAFDARIQGLDFGASGSADIINDWVSESTRGRIEKMIDPPIPGNALAYLMNAVYFKGAWTQPFDPRQTHTAPFRLEGGGTEDVRLMVRDDTIRYHQTATYGAVDLPYAGQAYSMTVVVPAEGVSIEELTDELDAEEWSRLTGAFQTTRVQLFLPRFELEWEGVLNDPLVAMGMGPAFGAGADFSRLFESGGGWISEVKQKSFVRVVEEGTEAAAVTSVAVVTSAPPQVRADRPFFFAIRERLSGTILFMGLIVEAPQD